MVLLSGKRFLNTALRWQILLGSVGDWIHQNFMLNLILRLSIDFQWQTYLLCHKEVRILEKILYYVNFLSLCNKDENYSQKLCFEKFENPDPTFAHCAWTFTHRIHSLIHSRNQSFVAFCICHSSVLKGLTGGWLSIAGVWR